MNLTSLLRYMLYRWDQEALTAPQFNERGRRAGGDYSPRAAATMGGKVIRAFERRVPCHVR